MLCSPNNPTGTVYTDEEMERLADICRGHGLYLIADEVYREFTYDGLKHRSVFTIEGLEDRVIVADSLSKRSPSAAPGSATSPAAIGTCGSRPLKFGQARLCPPTLGQHIGDRVQEVPPGLH